MRGRRRAEATNPWPGYVDALATLLMVIIFVLLVFVLAQGFLSVTLSARDRALDQLNRQVAELAGLLALERGQGEELQRRLAASDARLRELTATRDALTSQIDALRAERDALDQTVRADRANLTAQRDAARETASEQSRLSDAAQAQVARLSRQIEELRAQLGRLAAALDAAGTERDAQVTDLRARLNAALLTRVEELQRYRSDFFGRLREVLGDRPELRIVGDRFVFQSEVLFPPASAELSTSGERQMRQLARTLIEIAGRIPPGIPWVLRVDGHADRTPIRSPRFASNWELSAARAIAVALLLVQEGLPASRVAAAAFGENQPLDPADTPEAYARNRRIELRLTDR